MRGQFNNCVRRVGRNHKPTVCWLATGFLYMLALVSLSPRHTWITFCKLFCLFTYLLFFFLWGGDVVHLVGLLGEQACLSESDPCNPCQGVGEPVTQSRLLTRTRASSAMWVRTQCSLKVQLYTFSIYFDVRVSFSIPPYLTPSLPPPSLPTTVLPFLSLSFSNYSNTVYLRALSG